MAKKPPLRIRTRAADPGDEVPPGQPQRVLFHKLGLDPKNPQHWEQVDEYLAKHAPRYPEQPLGGWCPVPYTPEDPAPPRNQRRPQEWYTLAYRRLVQRVERLHAWYPDESELAICTCLAKHCPEYKDRKAKTLQSKAKTLQRRLAEARKLGIT